jgi:hypothetical protein
MEKPGALPPIPMMTDSGKESAFAFSCAAMVSPHRIRFTKA